MSNIIRVFIENPAGYSIKNLHDEKTLEFRGSIPVARPYPFPYGFILGTTGEDGDNLDCFVLTGRSLGRGDVIDCSVVGLMEQFENGKQDHNVLAVPVGEPAALTEPVISDLSSFVTHVFEDRPGTSINAGEFLDAAAALRLIKQCSDNN